MSEIYQSNVARELSWALCISTLNRIDILEEAICLALTQTVLPKEVIIIDASDDWEINYSRINNIGYWGDVNLIYQASNIKSLTRQRNVALKLATADILFFFDDDTLMHPECAEKILRIYTLDTSHKISAVAATATSEKPDISNAVNVQQKISRNLSFSKTIMSYLPDVMVNFIEKELLMLRLERRFIPYDSIKFPTVAPIDIEISETGAHPIMLISGYRMTVRRNVAEQEPFDDGLISYCPAEDLDATYRFSRHGINVQAPTAFVYHHEANSGRLKRRKVAELSLLNIAYFLRCKSKRYRSHVVQYYLLSARMVLSCFLRDLLGKRLTFPDTFGTLASIRKSLIVFRTPLVDIRDVYYVMQKSIIYGPT